jgi:type II secretory pathway pseudopilin PulG
MTQSHTASHTHGARAYTLVEMMVVMVILIVVMALVAPVIGNARNAAKRTNTQQLLSNLSQASQQFEIDHRTMPGRFTAVDMGSTDNATRGFTELNNVLLDLAGGVVETGTGNPPVDALQVGPLGDATRVYVRVGLIGAPTQTKGVVNKGYFTPDPKYFQLQNGLGQKSTTVNEHLALPDVIDGFGQPILAWRQDVEPSSSLQFAQENSGTARASFYVAPNYAFLRASKLGKKEQDQNDSINGSLLGEAYAGSRTKTMEGLLGNPAFPGVSGPGPDRPAASRGKLVFHSAGTDGIFLGKRDRGGLIATADGDLNAMEYQGGRDPLDDFDDVFSVAGN